MTERGGKPQRIERLARCVRKLRQRGKLSEADAEVRAFRCGDLLALPHGPHRRLVELREAANELERLRS